jgi:ABC-type nitrate/sulfonate/bicarbonate transport system ATPase subunit
MTIVPAKIKIRFEGVTKKFLPQRGGAEISALVDLDLAINENEFVCLVGPSGCGKSTLLNLLAGFEQPSAGRVLFDGVPVASPHPDRGVVFQDGALFPWLTVLQNVCYGPLRRHEAESDYLPRAKDLLANVGLSKFTNSMPSELSGGMRQRVAIARALINRPQLLLMDEPFGALDAQTRQLMQKLLLNVWQQDRRTVLFITHDVDESVFLADRVVAMSRRPGRIMADVRVPLGRPRDYALMKTREFLDTREQVMDLVRREAAAIEQME